MKTAVIVSSSLITAALMLAGMAACAPTTYAVEIVNPDDRQRYAAMLKEAGISFTVDERAYVICNAGAAQRCKALYDKYQMERSKK